MQTGSDQAPHIQFPLNGSRIDVDRSNNSQLAPMPVKVAGGVLPLTVLVNGISAGDIDSRRQRLIDPPGPGFARLTVIDATGAADTVVIRKYSEPRRHVISGLQCCLQCGFIVCDQHG